MDTFTLFLTSFANFFSHAVLFYLFCLLVWVSNREKQRWEDICAFRVFPFKCQTSLQLFELADDYIQQEIRKPPNQQTCTVSFSFLYIKNQDLDKLKQLEVAALFFWPLLAPGYFTMKDSNTV